MPDYTVRVALERPAIVVGVRSHAYAVTVPQLHTYTVETGLEAAPPVLVAPVNTVAPVVSGTTTEGQTLTCTEGTWTGTLPITYAYQWYRDDGFTLTPVGTNSSTYTLVAGDVGYNIFCNVTATNGAGSTPQVSNTVGPIASAATPPVNTVAPVASGVVRIGELLSTTDGTWTGTPTPTYAYQWTRDGAPIGSATSSTYTVVAADIACEIACEVTATNSAGSAMEPSSTLASPWQPILAAKPGILIWDGQDPYCYGGASVGSPVTDLYTVDGILLGTQGTTASRATRLAASLSADGTDDHYPLDAHAGIWDGAHTIVTGWSDPAASGTRQVISAAATTSNSLSRQARVTYVSAGSGTIRAIYYHDGGGAVTASLASLAADADLITRAAAPGGAFRGDQLTTPLTAVASATRPAASVTHAWATLFALRYAAGPSINGYWQGKLRHLALDDSYWSDTDSLLYRTCAIAAGVM